MVKPSLKPLVLLFLWGATIEDTVLFVLSWLAPELWFRLLHHQAPEGLDVALLRRAGGQWLAFAVVQAIALVRWREQPTWLLLVAGARASDLFTDLAYLLAAPSMSTFGWAALLPPPALNAVFIAVMWVAWRQGAIPTASEEPVHRDA